MRGDLTTAPSTGTGVLSPAPNVRAEAMPVRQVYLSRSRSPAAKPSAPPLAAAKRIFIRGDGVCQAKRIFIRADGVCQAKRIFIRGDGVCQAKRIFIRGAGVWGEPASGGINCRYAREVHTPHRTVPAC